MGTGWLSSEHIWPEAAWHSPKPLGVSPVIVSEAPRLPLPSAGRDAGFAPSPRFPRASGTPALVSAVKGTLKTRWFWYAMASSLCWTGWAFTAKMGSKEIPPATMEFISAFGFVLVSLGVLRRTAAPTEESRAGKGCALASGVLLALGGICLYGAYRTGYNASVITAVTSLYPMVTVLCAVRFLREKLNRLQILGLLFAAAAMSILSL